VGRRKGKERNDGKGHERKMRGVEKIIGNLKAKKKIKGWGGKAKNQKKKK